MTKTEHLKLPQWDLTDQVKMSDFNEAFAAVEKKCGNCLTEMGSYVGTGTYGISNHSKLEFSRPPLFLILLDKDWQAFLIRGKEIFLCEWGSSKEYCNVIWKGNTVEWYSADIRAQFNTSGTTYHYIAIFDL